MSTPPPGTGYFISPERGPGPGVLLLHSFWGLNRAAKDTADRLADSGFTVLAPDLAEGQEFDEPEPALDALAEADVNVLASLIQSSVGIVRRAQARPDSPIGVVGYGSGASWALWLSARLVDEIGAVVTYYGAQSIGMERSRSSYLCHWAESDDHVTDDDIAQLGLSLTLADRPFRFEHHEGTSSGFAEADRPAFDPGADAIAWRQTTEVLAEHL